MRCVASLLVLFLSVHVFAENQTVFEKISDTTNLHGSFRSGYFSSSLIQDDNGAVKNDLLSGSLWLRTLYTLDANISVVANGWLRNDDVLGDENSQSMLREGYVNITANNMDFRIGKQIIVWGRADRLNPTDVLTPRNFTWLIPVYEEQRYGKMAVKSTYHFPESSYSVSGIWLPNDDPSGNEIALKLDDTGEKIDWSISYFNGFDQNADYKTYVTDNASYGVTAEHNRIRTLGMDASTVIGRYGLRTEAAYNWTVYDSITNALVKKPFLYAVAGGDRTFFENFNINIQYYFRYIPNYQSPSGFIFPVSMILEKASIASNQQDKFQHGFSLRLANKWMNEVLEGEISGQFSMTRTDYVIKPRLMYAFNDELMGTVGADIYRGNNLSFYGQFRNSSCIFFELKYSF